MRESISERWLVLGGVNQPYHNSLTHYQTCSVAAKQPLSLSCFRHNLRYAIKLKLLAASGFTTALEPHTPQDIA